MGHMMKQDNRLTRQIARLSRLPAGDRRLNESGRFPALEAALEKVVMVLAGAVGAQLGTPDRTAIRDRSLAIWSLAHGYTTSVLHRRIKVKSTPAAERFLCELAAPFLEAGAAGR